MILSILSIQKFFVTEIIHLIISLLFLFVGYVFGMPLIIYNKINK